MRGRAILTQPDQPFRKPWQAQAFAMTLALHEAGVFSWSEWTESLSASLVGGATDGSDYYDRWLMALESLLVRRAGVNTPEVEELADAWARAAQATPHGAPIRIENDPLGYPLRARTSQA